MTIWKKLINKKVIFKPTLFYKSNTMLKTNISGRIISMTDYFIFCQINIFLIKRFVFKLLSWRAIFFRNVMFLLLEFTNADSFLDNNSLKKIFLYFYQGGQLSFSFFKNKIMEPSGTQLVQTFSLVSRYDSNM